MLLYAGKADEMPDDHVGPIRGADRSLRPPAIACVSLRELVSWLVNGLAATTGTRWFPMVRRRSTVRHDLRQPSGGFGSRPPEPSDATASQWAAWRAVWAGRVLR